MNNLNKQQVRTLAYKKSKITLTKDELAKIAGGEDTKESIWCTKVTANTVNFYDFGIDGLW